MGFAKLLKDENYYGNYAYNSSGTGFGYF